MIGGGLAIPELAVLARRPSGFQNMPTLAAAYGGGRGLVSIIGDSTSMGWGAGTASGSGMLVIGSNAVSSEQYLIAALQGAGITAIDNCFGFGDRNCNAFGVTLAECGQYYSPAATFGTGWSLLNAAPSPWGAKLPYNNGTTGTSVVFTPARAYDRVEWFHTRFSGGGTLTLDIGGTVFGTIDQNAVSSSFTKASFSLGAAQTGAITAKRTSTGAASTFAMGARCWLSGERHVQVETLGVSGWKTSDWLVSTEAYSPRNAIAQLGSHLFIIDLGVNDKNNGRTIAAYKADLKTLATTCRATGADVLLAIPHLAQNAAGGYYFDASWAQAVIDAASELGLPPPIDLRAIGLVAADYQDDIHLRSSGYAKVGQAYAARLLS